MARKLSAVKSIPQHVEMYWPTLQALKEMGGSGTIQELDDRVIRLAGYSEELQSILHQGGPQTEIAYRLAWVRTHLRVVGAVDKSGRGIWVITDLGRSLKQADMAAIPAQLRKKKPLAAEDDNASYPKTGENVIVGVEGRAPQVAFLSGIEMDVRRPKIGKLLRDVAREDVPIGARIRSADQ